MKKIAIISLCLLLLGVSIAAAAPGMRQQQTTTIATTGTFSGDITYQRPGPNATIIGTISGTYEMRSNSSGRFTGNWVTENRSGSFTGGFGRHILLGKISMMVNGTQKSLPFIGFIGAKDGVFVGRAMSLIGPALYFKGNYT